MKTQLKTNDGSDPNALAEQVAELRTMMETRLDELRGRETLDALGQVSILEKKLCELTTRYRLPNFDTLLKLISAIMPILLLGIGYYLIDTVKFAFEERRIQVQEGKLDLSATQGMRDLLEKIREPDVDEDVAKINALLVAGYGMHGIAPLLMDLDLEKSEWRRSDAAVEALKSYVFSEHREVVCTRLQRVLNIPRFGEAGMERALTLVYYLDCQKLVPDLEAFEKSSTSENLKSLARDTRARLVAPKQ